MSDTSLLDNRVVLSAMGAALTALTSVVVALWKRLDGMNAKCIEDRDRQNQERNADNKTWFEKVERLYQERGSSAKEMFDQVVKLAEKGKDGEHATINALVEAGRMMSGHNTVMASLVEKIDDLSRDIRQAHGHPKDSSGG